MSWNTPHTEQPDHNWYHPKSLLWLLIEIPYILYKYTLEKYYSVTARRWALEMQLTQAMQQAQFIATDESLPLQRRKSALRTMRKLKRMSEELNINNHHIEGHISVYEEHKPLLE